MSKPDASQAEGEVGSEENRASSDADVIEGQESPAAEEEAAEAEAAPVEDSNDVEAAGEADATTSDADGEASEEPQEELELPPLVPVLEAALFASAEAVPLTRLTRVLGAWNRKQVVAALKELVERQEREGSGVRVVETAGGFQLRSVVEYAPWVRKFFAEKPPRLSRAVLETVAVVAYRQPATRGEVEAVRGVNCDAVLGALTARGLVQVIGRRQSPGRPVEYGTTPEFLELFSLKDLADLPPLPDPASLANLIEEARLEEEAGVEGGDDAVVDGVLGGEEHAEDAALEVSDELALETNEGEPDGTTDGQEAAGGEQGEANGASDGEAAEDPESGGDRLEAISGDVDSGGESPGQREGDSRAGSEG